MAFVRDLFVSMIRRHMVVAASCALLVSALVILGSVALFTDIFSSQPRGTESWDRLRKTLSRPFALRSWEVGSLMRVAATDSLLHMAYVDRGKQKLMFAKGDLPLASWPPASVAAVADVAKGGEHLGMAVAGDRVHLCYSDNTTQVLVCNTSRDGGAHWDFDGGLVVDPTPGVGQYVSVAVRGSDVFVAYSFATRHAALFARSPDGGRTWPADLRRVIDGTAKSKGGRYTSLVVTPTRLLVAYQGAYDDPRDGQSLRVASSDDNGSTWETTTIDGPSCTLGTHASMAYAAGVVAIAYASHNELRFIHSDDEGRTWDKNRIKTIATNKRKRAYSYLSLRLDPPVANIAFVEQRSLAVASTADLGGTWSVTAVDDRGKVGYGTAIVESGDTLYLSYMRPSRSEPSFAVSTDAGRTWALSDVATPEGPDKDPFTHTRSGHHP